MVQQELTSAFLAFSHTLIFSNPPLITSPQAHAMSETWDPDHALPAPYLSYKRQACDNENRPIDELWNERFREGICRAVQFCCYQRRSFSEPEKAEWVYWADRLKTADSTKTLYNHLLGKAGTGPKHRRMSWACICAVLCNPRWSEESIRNGGKGKGWAARAATAYPNANIWRGQPNEEQADAAITGQADTNDDTEEQMVTGRPTQTAGAQSARYKSLLKTKRGKDHARTITQRFYDRMRKKAQRVKSFKSRDTGGELKKFHDALHRRDREL
ncbi:hypothetical protein FPCIR_11711 [Fusarium pseudocircinatum]|uniref:Uncharacterized protein n=1 Tax=Fusarium pseudocircinatum TaxID=56676 RepID=A0A8H5KRY3_9HYPO|nr:hypothetical protein FPCIR_11711 [Fusarium pseudocircinatum]